MRDTFHIGIAGAGVVGRLLALKAHARDWNVALFDRDFTGASACSHVPPAMLAPWCELDVSEREIAELGKDSPRLWQDILKQFKLDVYFQQQGSLVVAHAQDRDELTRFKRNVVAKASSDVFREVSGAELHALEPELDQRFANGLYFPQEGQIDSRGFLKASGEALQRFNIPLHEGEIERVAPGEIASNGQIYKFDLVLDCRGYGAARDLPELRAQRGEIIRLHAPGVRLNRPVRLMHPRYPLYAVPRPNGHFIVGATSVEAEDASPLSVRSALELLSAAFALHSGFGEARIIETTVGLRPAFPDNLPRIIAEPGLMRINGLFRHGYLLAPRITDDACRLTEQDQQAKAA